VASLFSISLGIGMSIAPIVAGVLYDYGEWLFTTEISAYASLFLAAIYGLLVLIGY